MYVLYYFVERTRLSDHDEKKDWVEKTCLPRESFMESCIIVGVCLETSLALITCTCTHWHASWRILGSCVVMPMDYTTIYCNYSVQSNPNTRTRRADYYADGNEDVVIWRRIPCTFRHGHGHGHGQ